MDIILAKPVGTRQLKPIFANGLPGKEFAGMLVDDAVNFGDLATLQGELEEDFESVVERFLILLPQRVEEIRKALAMGDQREIARMSHSLKGGSLPFGARRLSDKCHRLETAAREGRSEVYASLMGDVAEEAELVRAFFHSYLGKV